MQPQVHPAKLTTALMAAAQARGARLVRGTVRGLQLNKQQVEGVLVESAGGEAPPAAAAEPSGDGNSILLPADAVVLCMGPWTGAARAWLPAVPPIDGQKYHSVVLQPTAPVSGHMLFTAVRMPGGKTLEPELYPRCALMGGRVRMRVCAGFRDWLALHRTGRWQPSARRSC